MIATPRGGEPRDEGKRGGDPQEERERMRHLPGELPRPADPGVPRQLVRAVRDEAALRITTGEPLGTRTEVAQKQVDGLAGVANGLRFRDRRLGDLDGRRIHVDLH